MYILKPKLILVKVSKEKQQLQQIVFAFKDTYL